MKIQLALSYLSYPSKNDDEQPQIFGTKVPLRGKLHEMLQETFDKSDTECNIDISFIPDAGDGKNICRNLILDYLQSQTVAKGKKLAERLQSFTTHRSGLGLLFLLTASENSKHKLVISRFPADSGILAETTEDSLSVEFIEKVFLKNAHSYKSALYFGNLLSTEMWDGRVVDRQVNSKHLEVSDYWIKEFLLSDIKLTSATGSRRLAQVLKKVVDDVQDISIKEQVAAVASLVAGMSGKITSISGIVKQLKLSSETEEAIKKQLPHALLYDEKFKLDAEEFKKHLQFKSAELDTGALLIGPAEKFDEIFQKIKMGEDRVRYITEGREINQRLRNRK